MPSISPGRRRPESLSSSHQAQIRRTRRQGFVFALCRRPFHFLAQSKSPSGRRIRDRRIHRSSGARRHFGALLLGAYDRGKLRSSEKSAPDSTRNRSAMLFKKFRPLVRRQSPFVDPPRERDVHFYPLNWSPKFLTRNGPPTKNFASPFFSVFAMTKAPRKSACRSSPHENETKTKPATKNPPKRKPPRKNTANC